MLSKSSNALLKLPFEKIEEFRCPMGAFHLIKDADYNLPFFDTVFYELNCVKENDLSKRNALLVNKIVNCPNFSKKGICWKIFEEQHNEAVLNRDINALQHKVRALVLFARISKKSGPLGLKSIENVFKDRNLIKNLINRFKQNSKNL